MPPKRPEELLLALLRSARHNVGHGPAVERRPTTALKLPGARRLSCLVASRTRPIRPTQVLRVSAALDRARGYASSTNNPPRKPGPTQAREQIAVLGGGITGLTAVHYLARHAPHAHITLYEASHRLGGWVDGRLTPVHQNGGGEVLLQRGPRMLRSGASSTKYDDLVLYDVLANLGIRDKLIYSDTTGPAGRRYIYYPDHLVKLPEQDMSLTNIVETIHSFLTEPLWEGAFRAGWRYHRYATFRKIMHQEEMEREAALRHEARLKRGTGGVVIKIKADDGDETVTECLGRLLGDRNAGPIKNIVSAMFHGIYGGDIDKISIAHSIFDQIKFNDIRLPMPGSKWISVKDICLCNDMIDGPNGVEVVEMAEKARDYSLLMFEDGLVTLLDALVADLKSRPNVTIKTKAPVSALEHKYNKVQVSCTKGQPQLYDQVLSTLYSRKLAELARPANSLSSLAKTEAVSIYVVNLWYPKTELKKEHGFGYLVPQTVPPEQNPECVLGVIFDSDIQTRNEVPGTKLTVMMGGHYWSDWTILPSQEMAVAMAKTAVERHLGIPADEDVVVGAKLCRDCIPQHTIGHEDRMRQAHYNLLHNFQGKLMVAGPSYTTIGIMPAMRAGFDAAMRIARKHGSPWNKLAGGSLGAWYRYRDLLAMAPPETLDHVGTTGLGWSTMGLSAMASLPARDMRFKKWASDAVRFLDDEGNWKDPELKEVMRKYTEKV